MDETNPLPRLTHLRTALWPQPNGTLRGKLVPNQVPEKAAKQSLEDLRAVAAQLTTSPRLALDVLADLTVDVGRRAAREMRAGDESLVHTAVGRRFTADKVGNFFVMRTVGSVTVQSGGTDDEKGTATAQFQSTYGEVAVRQPAELVRGAM
ncbi:hypothetical protein [Microbacterium sp. RU33B]|uniref:hypothetical protein n=1 Tax=Microbacterium sp. RU33B TaxID=1907390 RepID=UPI0009601229|nr:hypothetical protein [Microbacterium sp. RU33B]SIT72444.1 hypothetical protein SAMN05880545_1054 [Microbacterium sp. RU33B]